MMKKGKNKYKIPYPRKRANYSLQFYFDDIGTLNMTETCQGGEDFKKHFATDFYIFGRAIANSKLLSNEEKVTFRDFCKGFMNNTNKFKD